VQEQVVLAGEKIAHILLEQARTRKPRPGCSMTSPSPSRRLRLSRTGVALTINIAARRALSSRVPGGQVAVSNRSRKAR
jgi:hypothetical protein